MRPTIHQMRLFSSAARQPSFKAAAEEMCLSASALSLQLKQLEEHVGMALFEQIGRRKFLTVAGEEMLRSCETILTELERTELRLAQLKGGMTGTLKVAVVTSAKFFIPHLLGAFHRRYPEVKLELHVANRARILKRLEENADDLVIMAHSPETPESHSVPFLQNPLIAIAAPNHPLAQHRRLNMSDLEDHDFLLRESGSGTRMAMEELFTKHDIRTQTLMELGSSEAIKQGVMAGLGLSILSRHSVWLELRSGYLTELPIHGFPEYHQWYAVHLQQKQLSPVAATFLEFISQSAQQMVEEFESRFGPMRS